jgi:hypothetical protein
VCEEPFGAALSGVFPIFRGPIYVKQNAMFRQPLETGINIE